MTLLGVLLAVMVGLSLGMLGGGGSVLTVPIFVYAGGFAAKAAVAMSLPVVGVTSLVGALFRARSRDLDLRVALIFGGVAMAGAYAGARVGVLLPGDVQLTILAVVMLAAAVAMFRRGAARNEPAPVNAAAPIVVPRLVIAALGVGLLTGVVGIGGGFLVVPALVLLMGVPMKRAIGTSLLVIAMNAAAGLLGYVGRVDMSWGYVAWFTLAAIAGILAGTSLVRFVPTRALTRAFAVLLALVAVFVLLERTGRLA
ncbi:MAG TPA: sulfite exporter TauE/SafE family protein [Gemmatimonadaceae bacterium]|nr:sulfite exporter TauE/SafE family protein [Gemmatimonadaceae bacterium]